MDNEQKHAPKSQKAFCKDVTVINIFSLNFDFPIAVLMKTPISSF